MTRKLEEALGLPLLETEDYEELTPVEEEAISEANTIINSIAVTEKIDYALSTVTNLTDHDKDMDDIAAKAIKSYNDLCDLGLNVADSHTARLFEVAATMLKTAMEAKDAKVNRKLKTIELQLKKAKLDLDISEIDPSSKSNGHEFDRNMIMEMLRESTGLDSRSGLNSNSDGEK